MVQLIYGPKGSGKTKRLIDMTNAELELTKGDVVFIDDNKRYMYDVKRPVRFVDVQEYAVDNGDKLYGLVCGMIAQNFDIQAIYIDAFMHIVGKKPGEIEDLFNAFVKISDKHGIKFVMNVSGRLEEMPQFMKAHVI